MGTASDRYAGWVGQIYSEEWYTGRIGQRTKVVGDQKFVENVLPVESVAEYFEHFPVLEIDFTFYRSLLDKNGEPTQNFQVLKAYQRHLKEGDFLLLKVPQAITAPKLRRGRRLSGESGVSQSRGLHTPILRACSGPLGSLSCRVHL